MSVNSKKVLVIVTILLVFYLLLGIVLLGPKNMSLQVNPKYATPPSVFYYIKISREKMQSLFVFGEEDKADWDLDLAGKRIEEAKVLSAHHLSSLASSQIIKALAYQTEAKTLIEYLGDKTNTTYLTDKYNQNRQNLESLNKLLWSQP